MLVLAAFSAFLGCTFLAISQDRNCRKVLGNSVPDQSQRFARFIGWSLIGAALVFCILRDGGSFAALLWPLVVGSAAIAVAILLAFGPQLLKPFCWVAAVIGGE